MSKTIKYIGTYEAVTMYDSDNRTPYVFPRDTNVVVTDDDFAEHILDWHAPIFHEDGQSPRPPIQPENP